VDVTVLHAIELWFVGDIIKLVIFVDLIKVNAEIAPRAGELKRVLLTATIKRWLLIMQRQRGVGGVHEVSWH
jgi:hypothetical protein